MSKNIKNVLIIGIVLAALLGLWYYLSATETEDNGPGGEIVIYSANKEDIARLNVKTEGEEYIVYKESETWYPENKVNVTLLPVRMDILTDKLSKIVADQTVETDAKDLEKYGLLNPIRTTEVVLSDGEIETLCVGNETPDKSYRYFKIASSDTVYTVSWTALNDYAPMFQNLRNMDIASAYAVENIKDISIFDKKEGVWYQFKKSADLTEEEKAEDVVGSTTVNDWKMTSPFVATANDEKLKTDILEKLQAVWASDYINDEPKDLGEYGLIDPQYQVVFTRTDGTVGKLYIGDTVVSNMVANASDKLYIMTDTKPNVFAVEKEYFKYLGANIFEYLNTIPIITRIADVQSVTIQSGDRIFALGIDRKDGKISYSINDKAISEEEYKSIYLDLIGFTAHGISAADETVEGERSMTVVFRLNDGSSKEFYFLPKDERNSVIVINGKPNFYVLNKYVTNFFTKVEEYYAKQA